MEPQPIALTTWLHSPFKFLLITSIITQKKVNENMT